MNHYDLLDPYQKNQWKYSIHPEKFIHDGKPTGEEERNFKIKYMKDMKLLKYSMEKLKDSEEIEEVREFWKSLLLQAAIKSIDAFRTIDLEFQILVYRDSLPADQRRGPPPPPANAPKKPLETYHIPKCDHDECKHNSSEMPMMFGHSHPPASGSGVVKSYLETGHRIDKHDLQSSSVDQRIQFRSTLEKQVWQPGWIQPNLSVEQWGDQKKIEMDQKAAEEAMRPPEKEFDEDNHDDLEAKRIKDLKWDEYCDDVPAGYGNTKRL